MTPNPRSEEAIFTEALRTPTQDRAAYLDRACASDSALRRAVEGLLASQFAVDKSALSTTREKPNL